MNQQAQQITLGETNPEYQEFVDKFKPKLTTDDCYTPENIYETVREWVFEHYGLSADTPVIRPFWPSEDYEREEYPAGCVVIDNPPFSILAAIERFYLDNRIRFFLFAPALSLIKPDKRLHYVICGETVTYANGAQVNTSFVTSMGEWLLETCPDLAERIATENRKNEKAIRKQVPKYEYPLEVVTAARCNFYAQHGIVYRLRHEDTHFIRRLDAQGREKAIFGGGLLISRRAAAERAAAERAAAERAAAERAAAERAAAERAAVTRWKLSEREERMIEELGSNGGTHELGDRREEMAGE